MHNEFLSNQVLLALLDHATAQERLDLSKVFENEATRPLTNQAVVSSVARAGCHSVANWLRSGGTGYIDIVDDVAKRLKVEGLPSYHSATSDYPPLSHIDESFWIIREKTSIPECRAMGDRYCQRAEHAIILKLLSELYAKLSDSDKAAFDRKLAEHLRSYGSSGKHLAGTAGLIALENLGGFATYTFLTSVMSVLSFGALSFGAYTVATSALHVLLGPVGWGLGRMASSALAGAKLYEDGSMCSNGRCDSGKGAKCGRPSRLICMNQSIIAALNQYSLYLDCGSVH